MPLCTLGILSDIHYASAAEQARGDDYELRHLNNGLLRVLLRLYRHHVWLRHPLRQNHLLDKFVAQADGFDFVIANGDYCCDSANLGISDDAACQSARECLDKLRQAFGSRLRANFGDHELGKLSLIGKRGGMRLESYRRGRQELGLEPFWRLEIGRYVLLGMVSSLIGLPIFEADALPSEMEPWQRLRAEHLARVQEAFVDLEPGQKVLLFCHDPTALPFLWREPSIQARLGQIEQTVIGHLHSRLILWKSCWLAGMPEITFLGHTVRRLSGALHEARHWKPFHVRLCPSLAGIELLKDGGFLTARLDPEARQPIRFEFHRLPRDPS
jgi:hypothetical protein